MIKLGGCKIIRSYSWKSIRIFGIVGNFIGKYVNLYKGSRNL